MLSDDYNFKKINEEEDNGNKMAMIAKEKGKESLKHTLMMANTGATGHIVRNTKGVRNIR